jgi:hypothetical protein
MGAFQFGRYVPTFRIILLTSSKRSVQLKEGGCPEPLVRVYQSTQRIILEGCDERVRRRMVL